MYRVGILGFKASDPSEARQWQAFQLELGRRGWIEGKNILIESRWAEGNTARIPELAAALVRLRMDLIVTRGSIFVQGAKAVRGGPAAQRGQRPAMPILRGHDQGRVQGLPVLRP